MLINIISKFTIFLELEPVTLTLAIIGKIGSSGAFGVIYVFSAELFPTVVRNAGMGASSCVARIGGMLAPYVAKSVITHFDITTNRFVFCL